jgi:hypothetical protein
MNYGYQRAYYDIYCGTNYQVMKLSASCTLSAIASGAGMLQIRRQRRLQGGVACHRGDNLPRRGAIFTLSSHLRTSGCNWEECSEALWEFIKILLAYVINRFILLIFFTHFLSYYFLLNTDLRFKHLLFYMR